MDHQSDSQKEARLWAMEWQAKQSTKRGVLIVAAIIVLAIGFVGVRTIKLHSTRMVFDSVDSMRAYMQGTFRGEREAFVFDGNNVKHLYYIEDDINEITDISEDRVIKWDYRHGEIDFGYMSDAYIAKDGSLVQNEAFVFYKEK